MSKIKVTRFFSKQQLKDFARRFVIPEQDEKRRIKKKPIALETASLAIEHFLLLRKTPKNYLKSSFIETRVKLLQICLEAKTPHERWSSSKDFLVERLASQILLGYPTLLEDQKIESRHILAHLLNPDSLLCWCIKAVVLFNATDGNIHIPKDVVCGFGGQEIYLNFPQHSFVRYGTMLRTWTKEKTLVAEKYLPDKPLFTFQIELKNRYKITYSLLVDQDSNKSYLVRHDKFIEELNKQHPGLVKLDSRELNIKLSNILEQYLTKEAQIKFLQRLTKEAQEKFAQGLTEKDRENLKKQMERSITKWTWKQEGLFACDCQRVVKDYFPDCKEEQIESVSWRSPVPWKPDNYLLDEDSLRYELADLYLQRLDPYEREKILIQSARDFSIFKLKVFRDLVEEWESSKDFGKIGRLLEILKYTLPRPTRDSKERKRWLVYVKVEKFKQQGHKTMIACRLVNPEKKPKTVHKIWERQRDKARKLKYKIGDPQHLEEIKREWNIEDWELDTQLS